MVGPGLDREGGTTGLTCVDTIGKWEHEMREDIIDT